MQAMKQAMNRGKSFNMAHKIAMEQVGANRGWRHKATDYSNYGIDRIWVK